MTSSATSSHHRSAFIAGSNGVFKVVLAALLVALSVGVVTAYCEPDETPAPPTISAEPQAASDVNERESRLRAIEDELLKQLSMGNTSSPREATSTKLPDIKHVEAPQNPAASAAPVKLTSSTPKPIPTAPQGNTEPAQRAPRSVQIIPASAKQAPRRVPQYQGSKDPKDLEHRLAIAESQATILSRELDSTKQNLQKSEGRVNELSQIVEKGGVSAPAPKYREVGGYVPASASQEEVRVALNSVSNRGIPSRSAPTARISRSNTPLRLGPGRNESALFPLTINTIVTIEHRTGVWYRVVTSTGTRGWVSGDTLIFSDGDFPGSTVHIGGIRAENEPESLR